jgi:hypothetical protein
LATGYRNETERRKNGKRRGSRSQGLEKIDENGKEGKVESYKRRRLRGEKATL